MVSLDSYLVVTEPLDANEHQMWLAVGHDERTKYDEDTVRQIIRSFLKWGAIFTTRISLAWSQVLHETGDFRFGGQVLPEQWNFAGIGSTNDGARGRYFPSIDEGVLAFFCHRALYQWGEKENWPAHLQQYFDKAIRYTAVRDAGYLGTCTVVRDFTNGRWAWSPQYPKGTLLNGYASAMVRGANDILDNSRGETVPENTGDITVSNDLTADILNLVRQDGIEVHDIRNRMPTKGSYEFVGRGWPHKTVHYTAVWRERNTLEAEINSWVGHANYHVHSHGWPGIAYAIGISASGRVFGLRDAERKGFHAFSANDISIGISNDITQGQKPTPQMERSLLSVLIALDKLLPNSDNTKTWGHREMKWYDTRNAGTTCPGSYLLPFTQKYRAGEMTLPVQDNDVPMQPDRAVIEVPGLGTFWVIGNIFQAWSSIRGNIQVYGYPITGAFEEDGDVVQYFERAVLREKEKGYWPDNFDVDFEAVGRVVYQHKYGDDHAPGKKIPYFKDDAASRVFIPETGHSMSYGFLQYWREFGNIKIFGWPISEEFEEDGRTVQYFERARFEHHPGADPKRYDVLLGRLGVEVLALRQNSGDE